MKRTHTLDLYLMLFIFFLVPISTTDGLSINYLFALFPMIYFIMTKKNFKDPTMVFKILILLAVLIFALAFLYQDNFYQYAYRRLISFFLFMSIFLYCFIEYNNNLLQSFKYAIVQFSVLCTIYMFYLFYLFQTGYVEGVDLKDFVGTQRIGFIFVFAFWIACSLSYEKHGLRKYMFMLFVIIISIGILLTFSRSSIVALSSSLLIFLVDSILRKKVTISKIVTFLKLLFLIFVILILFNIFLEPIVDRFIALFFGHNIVEEAQNSDASAGIRFIIWSKILDFVANNPLTGSGFLGVWTIYTDIGSSHNQYMDILLRTGIVYFFIFILVLINLVYFLYKYERYMFYGFMGFIIYGLFHETFKESQGAFVLAFLFGWMAQMIRKNRNFRRCNE